MSSIDNNQNKTILKHLLLVAGLFHDNELIEINCCNYNISKRQINAETSFYIKPNNKYNVGQLIEISKIDKSKQKNLQYMSLKEAFNKFNKMIKDNYLNKNESFGILYINKDLLDILKDKIEVKNLISFNLFEIFNEYYDKNYDSLNKILSELNLKQNNNLPPCAKELKTMTRIINKIIKSGKAFYILENEEENIHPKKIESIKDDKEVKIIISSDDKYTNKNERKTNNEINKEENDLVDQDIQCYFIRFKNLPEYVNKIDIKELLYQYEIDDSDIAISYNIFGKMTGDIIIRLFNTEQYKEIFSSYNYYYFNEKYILELFDSNSKEFLVASNSHKFSIKNIRNKHQNIFIKISKIPQSSTESDLKNFFKNCLIAEDGIKFNRNSIYGEAIIAFEDEDECFEALQKNNGRLFKNQSVSLCESNLDEFEEFASSMAFENWMPILSELITPEDVKRSLYLKGFPLDVTKNNILKFLEQFNINHSNLVYDDKILKNFGSIIIKFFNEDITNEAKNWIKNNKFQNKDIFAENLLPVVNKGNAI